MSPHFTDGRSATRRPQGERGLGQEQHPEGSPLACKLLSRGRPREGEAVLDGAQPGFRGPGPSSPGTHTQPAHLTPHDTERPPPAAFRRVLGWKKKWRNREKEMWRRGEHGAYTGIERGGAGVGRERAEGQKNQKWKDSKTERGE